ncbi:MAG: signal recognition particle receptor subunit alpha, partial [Nanoarchaeota archaeon]
MFKFLKEKIKKAVESITRRVEEDKDIEVAEEKKPQPEKKQRIVIKTGLEVPPILREDFEEAKEEKAEEVKTEEKKPEEKKEKLGFFKRLFARDEKADEKEEEKVEGEKEKKGIFETIKEKIVTKKIDNNRFDELFFDLEFALLENNVAYEVVGKIKEDLRSKLVNKPIQRNKVEETIEGSLRESINEILTFERIDLVKKIKEKKEKPFVIAFLGVNGSGKTTTIARLANYLQKNKISCLMVAADTWRAASIEQIEEHGKKLGVRVVKHDYGSDPAAVCFDGIKAAKASDIDVVLVDTAGRQHSNENLMREMEKIVRVAKPDMKIFVGEALVGNDAVL